MNIFFVDLNPTIAAQSLCDKHVVKMCVEGIQMLSTAHHYYSTILSKTGLIYQPSYVNHRCNIWIRFTKENYEWLVRHTIALLHEYTYRYHKIHKCEPLARILAVHQPPIPRLGLSPPAQAMPEQYQNKNPVKAYRTYYLKEKMPFAKWTKRNIPDWILITGE